MGLIILRNILTIKVVLPIILAVCGCIIMLLPGTAFASLEVQVVQLLTKRKDVLWLLQMRHPIEGLRWLVEYVG